MTETDIAVPPIVQHALEGLLVLAGLGVKLTPEQAERFSHWCIEQTFDQALNQAIILDQHEAPNRVQ